MQRANYSCSEKNLCAAGKISVLWKNRSCNGKKSGNMDKSPVQRENYSCSGKIARATGKLLVQCDSAAAMEFPVRANYYSAFYSDFDNVQSALNTPGRDLGNPCTDRSFFILSTYSPYIGVIAIVGFRPILAPSHKIILVVKLPVTLPNRPDLRVRRGSLRILGVFEFRDRARCRGPRGAFRCRRGPKGLATSRGGGRLR